MKVCAIVITAYQTQDYVIEAINSLVNQDLPEGWTTKFYIGVDGCEQTASKLTEHRIPFYFSAQNVGTYVLTNSLLEYALDDGCEVFVRFDSDDAACENFILNGINCTTQTGMSRTKCIHCDQHLKIIAPVKTKKAWGSFFFSREVLSNLGGYHHYRASCDKYFALRAQKLGCKGNKKLPWPTYYYRNSCTSLTSSSTLGLFTNLRKEIEEKLELHLETKDVKISPVTTPLLYKNDHCK